MRKVERIELVWFVREYSSLVAPLAELLTFDFWPSA
jgi:hypothetical protein